MSSPGKDSGGARPRNSSIRASLVSRLPSRTRLFSVSFVVVLLVSTVLAPYTVSLAAAAGAATGLYEIPAPKPGVEQEYEGTYRVLASNDDDVSPDAIEYSGYFNNDYPMSPVELGRGAHSPTQALRYAATTDFYQTQVSPYSIVPYKDEWIPYSEWERTGSTEIRFLLAHDKNTYDGPKSDSGEWYVQTTNQYGDWRPVYRAKVVYNDQTNELELANPNEAIVHSSEGESTIFRSLHASERYLAYSENAPNERVSRKTSAVPMSDGEELYPTTDGGYMELAWDQGRHAVVKDTWVGVNNVFRGAWYRGRYVVGNGQVGAYVPWDSRIDVPGDYHHETTCTIEHHHERTVTRNNTTYTETWTTYSYPPKTEWAKYQLIDSSAEVESVRLDAPGYDGNPELNKFGNKGVWIGMDEQTSRPYEYPPGDYTLTATVRVDATVEKRWGVTSEKCSTFSDEETESYTVTQSYEVPITVSDRHADSSNIRATVVDGPGRDRVIIHWDGDQDLPATPWEKIHVKVGGKEVEINSPWRFYSVSRNTHVEVRSDSGVQTHQTTHTYNDRWPAIYHQVVSVGNISTSSPEHAEEVSWWERVDSRPGTTIPGTQLPDGVDAPENNADTMVYRSLAGDIRTLNKTTGESVSVTATSVFGLSYPVEVETTNAHESNLSVVTSVYFPEGDNSRVKLLLTDAEGNPLPGREIVTSGARGKTVTTNSEGVAWVTYNGFIFRARYNGDTWNNPGETYYSGSSATYIIPVSFTIAGPMGQLSEYFNHAVSEVVLIAEWVALGLFALWWVRRRRKLAA